MMDLSEATKRTLNPDSTHVEKLQAEVLFKNVRDFCKSQDIILSDFEESVKRHYSKGGFDVLR